MKRQLPGSVGLLSSAILSLLTLSVFWMLQSTGPESAVRKFHEAVAAGRPDQIKDVVTSDPSDPNVQKLAAGVSALLRANANIQLAGADRQPGVVNLQIVYVLRDGRAMRHVFVVRRVGRYWKIDAAATISFFRQSLGL